MAHSDEMSLRIYEYIKLGQNAIIGVTKNIRESHGERMINDNQIEPLFGKMKKEMTLLVNVEKDFNDHINAYQFTQNELNKNVGQRKKRKRNDNENESDDNEEEEEDDDDDDEENGGENIDAIKIFEQKLKSLQKGKRKSLIEHNDKYKELMQMTQHVTMDNPNEDDELETLETTETIPNDPFTKRPIENPVKNKKCGHVYDRDALRCVIEGRRDGRVRCPNIGCNNREVTMNDVVDDVTTKILIDRLQREANQ